VTKVRAIQFVRLGLIDQLEHARRGIALVEAASTCVTGIKAAPHFRIQRGLVDGRK
jgi:hypothetical protein